MSWWGRLTTLAWAMLDQHATLTAFLFLLIEEAGTPIPIPGDVVMVLMGARAAQGRISLLEALAIMELATVLGACCLYWVSARAGRRVIYRLGRYIGLTPERLDHVGAELNRRGMRAVIIARLTPGLRVITPVACGVFRFPFHQYLPAIAIGGFVYILIYTLLGYFFGPVVLGFLTSLEIPLSFVVSAILLGVLTVWTFRVGRAAVPPDQHAEPRERLWAGAAAGIIATLVAALAANSLIHVLGLVAFHVPGVALGRLLVLLSREIGRAPGLAVASLVVPALLGLGALLGAAYGAWSGKRRIPNGPLAGMIFALFPLALSLFVILPAFGAGLAGLQLGAGVIPALGETVRHLIYGLVLGTLYPALVRPRPRSRQRPPATGRRPSLAQPTESGAPEPVDTPG